MVRKQTGVTGRLLWIFCIPLALVAWGGLALFTGAVPPTARPAQFGALLILLFAVALSTAPLLWTLARRLRVPGLGERPLWCLRTAFWLGLWAAVAVGLRIFGVFEGLIVLAVGVCLGLLETFVQQTARPSRVR